MLNPDRPAIWIPATVEEIIEAMLDYHRTKREIDRINQEKTLAAWAAKNFKPDPSQVMTTTVYDEIKKEYEIFTSGELNHPAFSSSSEQDGVTGINARGDGRQAVRFNSACWDRSLPVAAVQFISLQYFRRTGRSL
jgi:hypothetical protein